MGTKFLMGVVTGVIDYCVATRYNIYNINKVDEGKESTDEEPRQNSN